MIDCPDGDLRDLLPDLLHDRLPASERESVLAHVRACAACEAELALLDRLRESLHGVPPMDVAAIVAAIGPAGVRSGTSRRLRSRWLAVAAAALIVAGGTTLAVVQRGGETASSPVATVTAPVLQPVPPVDTGSARVTARPSANITRELAVGSGTVGELTDGELASLLGEIERMDAVPSLEVDGPSADATRSPRGGSE